MLGRLNLNLLYTLYILLQERHVSRCAVRLNLTQSAVSRQLAQLRAHFNDPLLLREGNQLVETARAVHLRQQLHVLFDQVGEIVEQRHFEASSWQGEWVFASSDYVAQYIFPDVVKDAAKEAPAAKFHYELWYPHYLEKMADLPIQIAATMLPESPAGLSAELIGEDHPVCAMDSQHPLANKPNISLDDFTRYPHIRIAGGGDKDSFVDLELQKLGCARHVVTQVPFFSAAFSLLRDSDHLLVIPQHIAANLQNHFPLHYTALPFPTPTHRYWQIWHPKFDHDPAHQWFRQRMFAVMRRSMYSVNYQASE
uniref:LysR family transcriptional regulator n=1 Tax=Thaumasiovibrio occultus TaxID=1891184 RepID=UPI000B35E1C1|nr:LysR family transcriptional regulator [Thaumasiovibrio occultus]